MPRVMGEGRSALGAALTGLHLGDVSDGIGAEVTGVVGVEEVGVGLVCPDHEVVAELNGVVGNALEVTASHWRCGACDQTCRLDFFVGGESEVGWRGGGS